MKERLAPILTNLKSGWKSAGALERFLWVMVGLFLVFQLVSSQRQVFSWDETNALSQAYTFESGRKLNVFRFGLVDLFIPFTLLPVSEFTLLKLSRIITLFFGTFVFYFLIWRLASVFCRERLAAPLALFLLLAQPTFFITALQFRTDPFLTAIFLYCVWLLLPGEPNDTFDSRWRLVLLPGLLMGLAHFMNPKAVYFMLLLLGFYFLRSTPFSLRAALNEKRNWSGAIAMGLTAIFIFLILTTVHMAAHGLTLNDLRDSFHRSTKVGFGDIHGWKFRVRFYESYMLGKNPLLMLTLYAGVLLTLWRGWREKKGPFWFLGLAALGMLLTPLVHQGVYDYYLVIVLPVVVAGSLPGLDKLIRWVRSRSWPRFLGPVAVLFSLAVFTYFFNLHAIRFFRHNTNHAQGNAIRYSKQIFPKPVPYADGVGLIGGYNNIAGLFSNKLWIVYRYRNPDSRLLDFQLKNKYPIFMLNSNKFPLEKIHPHDRLWLRQNYIRFFRHLYVHGRRWNKIPTPEKIHWVARHDGPFLLCYRSKKDLLLNGSPTKPGVLRLTKGVQTIRCPAGCRAVELIYGGRDPRKIVPNFKIPARTKKKIYVKIPGQYYYTGKPFRYKTTVADRGKIYFEGDKSYKRGIYLEEGPMTVNNQNPFPVTIHPFGPIYPWADR